jgi:hypothetical protein
MFSKTLEWYLLHWNVLKNGFGQMELDMEEKGVGGFSKDIGDH